MCGAVLYSIHLWALFIVAFPAAFPGAVQVQSGLVCHCARCCSNSCVNVEWLLPWGYYSEITNRIKNSGRCGGEGGQLQRGALVSSGLRYVQPDTKWWAFHLFISLLPSKQLASLSFVCVSYLNRNVESKMWIAPAILLASCFVSSNGQPQAPQGKL